MPMKHAIINLRITRRELATILAALRSWQDKHVRDGPDDQLLKDIATDAGSFKPLGFRGINQLCEKLNIGKGLTGFVIEPPHKESGEEPLYRVVYLIDVNAISPIEAARQVHQIMMDMIRHDSQPPVLEILDHGGTVVSIDLSE